MKKIYIILPFYVLISGRTNAQLTDVIETEAASMAFKDNESYLAI